MQEKREAEKRYSKRRGQRFKAEKDSSTFAGIEDEGRELHPRNAGGLQKMTIIPGRKPGKKKKNGKLSSTTTWN